MTLAERPQRSLANANRLLAPAAVAAGIERIPQQQPVAGETKAEAAVGAPQQVARGCQIHADSLRLSHLVVVFRYFAASTAAGRQSSGTPCREAQLFNVATRWGKDCECNPAPVPIGSYVTPGNQGQ